VAYCITMLSNFEVSLLKVLLKMSSVMRLAPFLYKNGKLETNAVAYKRAYFIGIYVVSLMLLYCCLCLSQIHKSTVVVIVIMLLTIHAALTECVIRVTLMVYHSELVQLFNNIFFLYAAAGTCSWILYSPLIHLI